MPAKVYDLQEYRLSRSEPKPDPIDDTTNNTLWDRFNALATEAWGLRDRESVEELKEILNQLEPAIEVSAMAGSTV